MHDRWLKIWWMGAGLFLLSGALHGQTQTYIGFRFASNINYFPRPQEKGLVENGFTTGIMGPVIRFDKARSSVEGGVQVVYKSGDSQGFPNLPGVMTDFSDDQNVGLTAVEMDFRVGPRFKWAYPRIGYVVGYRFETDGFLAFGDEEVNKWYLHLPFGLGTRWKTNFGTVGTGAYFLVGITNVLKNPDPGNTPGGFYNGGRMQAFHIELTCDFAQRRK